MEKCWLLSNNKLEHRCGLSKSMDSLDALGHTSGSEEPILNDAEKKIPSGDSYNLNYSNYFFDSRNIWNLISDDTFLVKNSNGDSYSVYFNIENQIFDIDNASYSNSGSNSSNYYSYYSMYDTQSDWNHYINSCIDTYLRFEISLFSYIYSDIDSYINNLICTESLGSFNRRERSNNFDINTKYRELWVQCENCYGLNYKKFLRSKMNICEHCGYHFNMSSLDRIEFFMDPGTWEPMDEDMVSMDPIEFSSEEEPYIDYLYNSHYYSPFSHYYYHYYQIETGLTEAVQTGIGKFNSIPIAMGVMDFQFIGGSMGSAVGEKITRLIEYATNRSLPILLVCASGGARIQEGCLSLMQMAKISSASYDYQSNKKLFYVAILASPTTGGVVGSFGMLGDIVIAEPNACIAFAGKRVIEETLKQTVPDGLQTAEYSFPKGLFDPIVPRSPLKSVLNELFQLHGFLPLKEKEKKEV